MKKPEHINMSDERLAEIADKGLLEAGLKRSELLLLSDGEIEDVMATRTGMGQHIPALSALDVDRIMARLPLCHKHAPSASIRVRILEAALSIVPDFNGVTIGSPTFMYRGETDGPISFSTETAGLNAHVELIRRSDRLVDMHIRMTSKNGAVCSGISVELYKADKCIESTSGLTEATLRAVRIGSYRLIIKDVCGEIAAVDIELDAS